MESVKPAEPQVRFDDWTSVKGLTNVAHLYLVTFPKKTDGIYITDKSPRQSHTFKSDGRSSSHQASTGIAFPGSF